MAGTEIQIRLMDLEDIKQVLEVEKSSFTTPWTQEAFHNELINNRFAYYLVAETSKGVAGYCGVWVIADEAHITNIAVHPDFRGQKVGERLLRSIMLLARLKGALKMTLEVRVSNQVAQNLYRKLGFETTGRRKGYYTDNQEDALIMWADLEPCLADDWLEKGVGKGESDGLQQKQ
ncbi:ribosomal-protein-alanine N-acetyltransferase [Caldalkalibacillus uzonensis]|uniref:Ribosomal-protein-alanine N-acetyltransferase n=1 Tax=Caldalkalibacillus uzonensis TaxID=353224 RepID=A0ABU0CWF3_9BACI|nr:ribosomal protein S18-alanine N-acetyltransferase [Caldalkalibacillus uzonensis]MDQ0340443.1 ribosomal-protein-alanine N-acetyltransferase [Caldalkalibacillus uzonensis]